MLWRWTFRYVQVFTAIEGAVLVNIWEKNMLMVAVRRLRGSKVIVE